MMDSEIFPSSLVKVIKLTFGQIWTLFRWGQVNYPVSAIGLIELYRWLTLGEDRALPRG